MRKIYSRDEVFSKSLEYFNGDELAATSFFKYALKDKEGSYYENNPDQMHHRLAGEFARIEKKFGGKRALSKEKIYFYLKNFKYIVPQGSPMMGVGNNFVNLSLSNCVVIDAPKDTMSSIIDVGKDLANLCKRRCGIGLDISNLRPDGAVVSNAAGSSSGAWSFANFYSYITRMVGQNNRRGACLISLDVRHPDVEKFITMKYDLTKVTGANISVKITDEFMRAVRDNLEFTLKFPVESNKPTTTRVANARDIWTLIVKSATTTAEPGLLMWDNILKYLPAECYSEDGFKTQCVNPCGEICLSAFDSCRLVSLNLKNLIDDFFTPKTKFNWGKLKKIASIGQRLSDDLVELELEKLQNLIRISDTLDEKRLFQKLWSACHKGRRTGLGTHGLADALARLNLSYDSDDALNIIDKIYKTIKVNSYKESVELAKERGPFPVWEWNKERNNLFIKSLPDSLQKHIEKHGRRNISNLTNAPTGTVSIVSQTSSGIEPVFKNNYIRRKKKNQDEEFEEKDFIDDLGDHWEEFEVSHCNVRDWKAMYPKKSLPNFFVESGNINWEQRVKIQSYIQKHIDHSISSTICLPKETSSETVGKLYMQGWELGLKGLTVYVEGSRSGVLISKDINKNRKFEYVDSLRRPTELECDIHNVSVKGEKWIIFVGLLDEKPYEVFGGLSNNIEIPAKYKNGIIEKTFHHKTRPNRYNLRLNGLVIKDIIKQFDNPAYQVHTRMVSLALRHGARPSFLVEQLLKDPDSDLTSFSKVLSRVLKKYIENGTKVTSDKICFECKSEKLIYQEGCVTCFNCGYSKCG